MIIGGVLGPITRPDVVIAGLYRGDDLVVGRTVPLDPRQAAELGKLLHPAKPGHPWPDQISSQRWGGKDSKKPLTKPRPDLPDPGRGQDRRHDRGLDQVGLKKSQCAEV